MRLIILALCAATLASTPAWATATLSCDASLKQFDLQIMGTVPYGQGGPLTQLRGEVAAMVEGIADPIDIELDGDNNTQFWLDDDTLNLAFYKENETGGVLNSAELTIKTQVRADDTAYFDGNFHFESYRGKPDGSGNPVEVKFDGKVTCSVG